MRILYGAGQSSGANVRLGRFLKRCKHEVIVAAYYRNHKYLHHIDWALDAVRTTDPTRRTMVNDLFGHTGVPQIDYDLTSMILDHLVENTPDLIISDYEPITAHIAETMEIPLWYCSPLLMLPGLDWENGQGKMIRQFDGVLENIRKMPTAQRQLVYSPFCDLAGRPLLKEGFEWVKPYVERNQSLIIDTHPLLNRLQHSVLQEGTPITTGETCFVSDMMYQNRAMAVVPDLEDAERTLMAELCSWYGVGQNMGQLSEGNWEYAKSRVALLESCSVSMSPQDWGYLHDKVNEYETSRI
jgi:hypothetical protein